MPRVEVLTEESTRCRPKAAPARSVRRATARRASRRASNKRTTARSPQGDTKASIIDFLAQHAGSTAGDLAKDLNLNLGTVSSRLTQLAKGRRDQKGITRLPQRSRRPDLRSGMTDYGL